MKFIKIKEDPRFDTNLQRVFAGGDQDIEIGTVERGWFRSGGDGWTNSLVGTGGFPTRKEAARDLLKRFNEAN